MYNKLKRTTTRHLRVGDTVVMQMDIDARYWGRSGPEDGTIGTVVGKRRHKLFRTHFDSIYSELEPGVYEKDGAPIIQWEDRPEPETASDMDIALVDQEEGERRYLEEWVKPVLQDKSISMSGQDNLLNNLVWLSYLPETNFYELDVVRFVDNSMNRTENNEGRPVYAAIHKINYEWVPEREPHTYMISWYFADTGEYACMGSTYVGDSDLVLIERGNVWKHYHGQPTNFLSLKEEGTFAWGMNQAHEVRNPKTNLYSWTIEEALDALSGDNPIGGSISVSEGFGNGPHVSVHKFLDPDLNERFRLTTLEGFNRI